MKNLDEVARFIDPVVDQNGRMHELADVRPSVQWAADVREAFQQIEMVQDGGAEMLSSSWKISPRVGQDFLEIR